MRKWELEQCLTEQYETNKSQVYTIEHLMKEIEKEKKKRYVDSNDPFSVQATWKDYYDSDHAKVANLKGTIQLNKKIFDERIEEERAKWDTLDSKYNNALGEIKTLKGLKTWIIWSSDPNRRRHVEAKTQKEIGDYTVFSIGKDEIFKIKTSLVETIERR